MQSGIKIFKQFISTCHLQQFSLQATFVGLALVMLACGFTGAASRSVSDRAIGLTPLPTLTRTRLPTFTPTTSSNLNITVTIAEHVDATSTLVPVPIVSDASPTSLADIASTPVTVSEPDEASTAVIPPTTADTSTATPSDTPTILATEPPQPTDTATPQPTSIPSPTATIPPVADYDKWSFVNLNTTTNGDALVVYGEVINNTGVTQELDVMGGLFYDDQGEVIADDRNMETNWASEIVMPGEHVSFEIIVNGIQEAADFELNVEAQPAEDS